MDIERGVGTLVRAPDLIVKDDIVRPRFLLNIMYETFYDVIR